MKARFNDSAPFDGTAGFITASGSFLTSFSIYWGKTLLFLTSHSCEKKKKKITWHYLCHRSCWIGWFWSAPWNIGPVQSLRGKPPWNIKCWCLLLWHRIVQVLSLSETLMATMVGDHPFPPLATISLHLYYVVFYILCIYMFLAMLTVSTNMSETWIHMCLD